MELHEGLAQANIYQTIHPPILGVQSMSSNRASVVAAHEWQRFLENNKLSNSPHSQIGSTVTLLLLIRVAGVVLPRQ